MLTVKKISNIILPYWKSEHRFKAMALFITSILLSLGEVWVLVRLNNFTKNIYNALENKNYDNFIKQLYVFVVLVAIFVTIYVSKNLVIGFLQFCWRRWATNHFLNKWTKDSVYYQASINKLNLDNPDQRLSMDTKFVPFLSIELVLTFILEVVSLVVFCKILWDISSNFSLSILGTNYAIGGYLMFIALSYSIIGTFFAVKIGKPLINLSFLQEKLEANFRFSLIRIQERSEEIALFSGEEQEKQYLRASFSEIRNNFYDILIRSFYLNTYKAFYINLDQLIPLLAVSPMYFSGAITLGVVMQVASAFGQIMNSLSIIVQQFPNIASWQASIRRLSDFQDHIDIYQKLNHDSHITRTKTGNDIKIHNLSLAIPDGRTLLTNINLDFLRGNKYLVTGESGIGKSTLLKALAGLWVFGQGNIILPKEKIEFFAQRPYMLISTLRKSIFYPLNANSKQNQKLSELLDLFKLSHLKPLLDENKDFIKLLSLGEQQRISIIRATLHKPKWLIMDEPTSSLNMELQDIVFSTLCNELKNTTIITISHNKSSLRKYHNKHYELTPLKT